MLNRHIIKSEYMEPKSFRARAGTEKAALPASSLPGCLGHCVKEGRELGEPAPALAKADKQRNEM